MQQTEFLTRAMELLGQLGSEELNALEKAIGAELYERELEGGERDEGRGTLRGKHPAPAAHSSIDGKPQTVKVACGLCRGLGQKRTLIDGLPYECAQCRGAGVLEIWAEARPLQCGECGGPPDSRVRAGMKCGRCAY